MHGFIVNASDILELSDIFKHFTLWYILLNYIFIVMILELLETTKKVKYFYNYR